MLVDAQTGIVAAGADPVPYSFDLRAVEVWLLRNRRAPRSDSCNGAEIARQAISTYEPIVREWRSLGATRDGKDELSKQLVITETFLEHQRNFLLEVSKEAGAQPMFRAQ